MYQNRSTSAAITPSFDATAPFSDPFADLAAAAMPVSIPAMLRHAEYFSVADATLRAAYNRAAAYFLTRIKALGELGEDEKKKQQEYLTEEANAVEFCHEAGVSFLTYGNHYASVFHPITRYVSCPGKFRNGARCGARYRFGEFRSQPEYQFVWAGGIRGRCPACGFSGTFHDKNRAPVDLLDESRPLILRSWNPHDIRIVYNEATGQSQAYDWVMPSDIRTEIRSGSNPLMLEDTPWDWLMAGLEDKNVRFTPEHVHHWREPQLSGMRFRGIGVPRAIVNYRQLYYTRVISRMNEVLALGHIVPMRVISPANTSGRDDTSDILRTGHLGNVRGRVMQMVANWRADPSSVQFSPIALQMQSLGADARQLIPADILNQALETELNAADMPLEFYKMSMTTQNAPVGLRMLQRTWGPFLLGLNGLINFIGKRAQFLLKWEKAKYEFEPVTLVDDLESQTLRVQMAQAGLLSRSTAVRQVGEDFEEQIREKMQDQRIEQRLQAEFQEQQDAFGFGQQLANAQAVPGAPPGQPGQPGQAGPGAAPPGGDPNAQAQGGPQAAGTPAGQDPLQGIMPQPGQPMDPQEWLGRAQQAAGYLLTLPQGQRYGELQKLREGNSMFHQLVKGQMESMRSDDRSKGQQFMQSQREQGGGGQ